MGIAKPRTKTKKNRAGEFSRFWGVETRSKERRAGKKSMYLAKKISSKKAFL